MMSHDTSKAIAQISALAASGESETRKFEETTGTRREAAKTVCDRLIVTHFLRVPRTGLSH